MTLKNYFQISLSTLVLLAYSADGFSSTKSQETDENTVGQYLLSTISFVSGQPPEEIKQNCREFYDSTVSLFISSVSSEPSPESKNQGKVYVFPKLQALQEARENNFQKVEGLSLKYEMGALCFFQDGPAKPSVKTKIFKKLTWDLSEENLQHLLTGDLPHQHFITAVLLRVRGNSNNDFVLARKLLQKAQEKAHPGAFFEEGLHYLHGWGVEKSYDRGFKKIIHAAKNGHAAAQYWYGYELWKLKRLDIGKLWFKEAAAQGFFHARYAVTELLKRGHFSKKDVRYLALPKPSSYGPPWVWNDSKEREVGENTLEHYLLSTVSSVSGQTREFYDKTIVPFISSLSNENEGNNNLFTKEKALQQAMYKQDLSVEDLSLKYEMHALIFKNDDPLIPSANKTLFKRLNWDLGERNLQNLLDGDLTHNQFITAVLLRNRAKDKDLEWARKLLKKAQEQGHAGAFFEEGLHYLQGWGVDVNLESGYAKILKAARIGHVAADYVYAYLGCKDGHIDKAIPWFKLSAEQGHKHSRYIVGQLLNQGYFKDEKEEDIYSLALPTTDFYSWGYNRLVLPTTDSNGIGHENGTTVFTEIGKLTNDLVNSLIPK